MSERRYRAVVRVATPCGFGTGIAVSPYDVITAKHVAVCNVSDAMIVYSWEDTYEARIASLHPTKDVARLRLKEPIPFYLPVRKSPVRVGEKICYMGGNVLHRVDQNGPIRLVTKCGEMNLYDNDGDIWYSIHTVKGNSGGPLFDSQWRVVGIVAWLDPSATTGAHPLLWEHGGGGVAATHFP